MRMTQAVFDLHPADYADVHIGPEILIVIALGMALRSVRVLHYEAGR